MPAHVRRAEAHGPRRRVLIVDDEAALARALARTLRWPGPGERWHVAVAATAEEAERALAASEGWDAVVCDLHLAGRSGDEVLASAAARVPGAARVLLTGDEAGGSAFAWRRLTKPVDPTRLIGVLREAWA